MSFKSVLKALTEGDRVHLTGTVVENGSGTVSKELKVTHPHVDESSHELDVLVNPTGEPDNEMVITMNHEGEIELKQIDVDGFRNKVELHNIYEVKLVAEKKQE